MAEDILRRLVENSRRAVADGVYESGADGRGPGTDLEEVIAAGKHAVLITEVKFSSPSLGSIRAESDPAAIARQMEAGGASAISVLTQPHMFGGSPDHLAAVRAATGLPILMKDIFVDTVQVDAAARLGADYVLVIEALFAGGLLDNRGALVSRAHSLGLRVLSEAHTAAELEAALGSGADLVGINNRNLDTLEIDTGTTCRLLSGTDPGRPVISESGIGAPEDVSRLRACGASGFLVGSSLMKSDNIEGHVRRLVMAP